MLVGRPVSIQYMPGREVHVGRRKKTRSHYASPVLSAPFACTEHVLGGVFGQPLRCCTKPSTIRGRSHNYSEFMAAAAEVGKEIIALVDRNKIVDLSVSTEGEP